MLRALRCGSLLLATLVAPATAATLEEVLAGVYETNPRLAAARARLEAIDEEVPKALGTARPRLSARSTAASSRVETNRGRQDLGTFRQVLALEQALYTGGETPALVSRAENAVRAERARLSAVEQDVLLETVAVYGAVLRDRGILELARANETALQRQLAATRDRFRFGEVTRTDVAQAETRLARAIARRLEAEGELAVASADFLRLVGGPPGELVPVGLPAPLPASLEEALEAIETHPLVRAARFTLDGAEDDIAAALAALKPRIVLHGEAAYARDPDVTYSWQSEFSLGATVTVPLYQGGGEHARVRQTRKTVLQRRYDLDDTRRAVGRDIAAAWQNLATARARLASIATQIRSAELALDGVRTEALTGTRTVLDILDAEQELFTARVDQARAAYQEVVAAHALLAATGVLGVERLRLPTTAHDVEAHYRTVRGKWFGTGASNGARRP
ncbi:MAG: TolC family outer membrane protein [Geminicoccaceae bacterium]|nr:TolC family outer membrane protein [Geminicoccaceae bacterium]